MPSPDRDTSARTTSASTQVAGRPAPADLEERRDAALAALLAPELAHIVDLVAWRDGAVVGTVQLNLGTPENPPHRAQVEHLLVDPPARNPGVGRALMQRAEQVARRLGRSLLTLEARAGELADRLCRDLGWQEAGRVPGYALNADRTPADAVFLWKRLG